MTVPSITEKKSEQEESVDEAALAPGGRGTQGTEIKRSNLSGRHNESVYGESLSGSLLIPQDIFKGTQINVFFPKNYN